MLEQRCNRFRSMSKHVHIYSEQEVYRLRQFALFSTATSVVTILICVVAVPMIFTYLQYVHSSGHEFLDLCKVSLADEEVKKTEFVPLSLQHRNRQMRVELESIRSVKDPSRDPSERSRTREERAGGGGHWFIGSYVPVRLPRTSVTPRPKLGPTLG